jgi:glutamyl/glutaminyl-tRNA synthetase
MFRTRFAPSPTGYLHIGSARTALFAKLFAQNQSGVFFLRLEDTDRKRLQPDAFQNLLQTMSKIGLQADEGILFSDQTQSATKNVFYNVEQIGDYQPYIQSERLEKYQKIAQELIDRGLAYWSFLSEEDKQEILEIKQTHKQPINYWLENLKRYPEAQLTKTVVEGLNNPSKPALMYKLQRDEKISCHDELLGDTEFDLKLEEDFVILKSDGFPTYHLAHLVDDSEMQTSLVVRSQEWYSSLPKHITMYKDFFGKELKYAHLPVVLGETGNKKMSKRDGNVNLADYLDQGFLPEAVVNYLAFLGWNPSTEQELYLKLEDFRINLNLKSEYEVQIQTRLQKLIQNLAKDFNLSKLSKSPARFNLEKLKWFNREYIKMLTLEEFIFRCASLKDGFEPQKSIVAKLAYLLDKNRVSILTEFGTESDCILDWQTPEIELVKWKKITLEESLSNLKLISDFLTETLNSSLEFKKYSDTLQNSSSDLDLEIHFKKFTTWWEFEIKNWLDQNSFDIGSYLWPLRVALSGKTKSPSPFEILAILSSEEIRARLEVFKLN